MWGFRIPMVQTWSRHLSFHVFKEVYQRTNFSQITYKAYLELVLEKISVEYSLAEYPVLVSFPIHHRPLNPHHHSRLLSFHNLKTQPSTLKAPPIICSRQFKFFATVSMKKVNKQCLLDTPRTVRVSEKNLASYSLNQQSLVLKRRFQ